MSKIEGQQSNNLEGSGEAINTAQHGQPATQPVLGSMRGQIHWTEGWEKALSDDEADAFLEGRY